MGQRGKLPPDLEALGCLCSLRALKDDMRDNPVWSRSQHAGDRLSGLLDQRRNCTLPFFIKANFAALNRSQAASKGFGVSSRHRNSSPIIGYFARPTGLPGFFGARVGKGWDDLGNRVPREPNLRGVKGSELKRGSSLSGDLSGHCPVCLSPEQQNRLRKYHLSYYFSYLVGERGGNRTHDPLIKRNRVSSHTQLAAAVSLPKGST
jgi:hypothetical protein